MKITLNATSDRGISMLNESCLVRFPEFSIVVILESFIFYLSSGRYDTARAVVEEFSSAASYSGLKLEE